MKLLRLIWDEIIGLFVDDAALALSCVVLIALAVALGLAVPPIYAGILLLAGCVAILGWSVWRAVRGSH